MKKIIAIVLIVIVIYVLFNNCSSEKDKKIGEKETIINLVKDNLVEMEKENIDAYMKTIHPKSPYYQRTLSLAETIFQNYELDYELLSYKIINIGDNEARINFEQITRKKSGPSFRDNKTIGTHTLNKHEGKWKIFNTEIKEIIYLD